MKKLNFFGKVKFFIICIFFRKEKIVAKQKM